MVIYNPISKLKMQKKKKVENSIDLNIINQLCNH